MNRAEISANDLESQCLPLVEAQGFPLAHDRALALSVAISAKRQADALERIAKAAERLARTEYQGAILTQRRGG